MSLLLYSTSLDRHNTSQDVKKINHPLMTFIMSSNNNPLKRSIDDGSYVSPSSSQHQLDATESASKAKWHPPSIGGGLKSEESCQQRRMKRPRTELYHLEVQRFENVQRTMQFYQQALRETDDEDVVVTKNHSANFYPKDYQDGVLVRRNLERQAMIHHCDFQKRCQAWMDEAQERIDLKYSMDSIRNSINGRIKDGAFPSTLSVLNLGKETTERLIGIVAEYAGGMPSDSEVLDCHYLVWAISQDNV